MFEPPPPMNADVEAEAVLVAKPPTLPEPGEAEEMVKLELNNPAVGVGGT